MFAGQILYTNVEYLLNLSRYRFFPIIDIKKIVIRSTMGTQQPTCIQPSYEVIQYFTCMDIFLMSRLKKFHDQVCIFEMIVVAKIPFNIRIDLFIYLPGKSEYTIKRFAFRLHQIKSFFLYFYTQLQKSIKSVTLSMRYTFSKYLS